MNGKMIPRAVATARVALGGKVKGYPVRRGRGFGRRANDHTTSNQANVMEPE